MKKILAVLSVIAALAACKKDENPGGGDEPVIDDKNLVVVKEGVSDFVIAYSDGNADNAKQLAAAVTGEVSTTLSTVYYSSAQQTNEILIGKTGRQESTDLLAKLGSSGYGIEVNGTKLVIAGTDEGMTARALFHFQDSILRNEAYVSGKTLQIPKKYSFVAKNPAPVTFSEVLTRGHRYVVETNFIGQCKGQGDLYVAQGAASDGEFVWFVMRNASDTEAVIHKYRLSPFTYIGVGNTFDGGHCNDMTYDDLAKKLVLAHGSSQGKILTLIDPESLNKISDVNITVGAGAITFNKSRKQYAVSQGGSTLHRLNNVLTLLESYTRKDGMTAYYTAQGMGSDDDYIYFPMSPNVNKDNVLVTYDWKGNYVGDIHIDLSMESETMFCVSGKYYVSFYSSGSAKLYQIIPSIRYKYRK